MTDTVSRQTTGGETLPEGWTLAEIQDIGENKPHAIVDGPFGSNLKLSDYISGTDGVPVLTTKNLEHGYSDDLLRYISQEKFEQLRRSEVVGNDILMAKIGSCGKTGIYPKSMPSAIIPANLLKVSVNSQIGRMYVYYYFDSSHFKQQLNQIIKATAQPAFGVTKFKQLSIPIPPLNEQSRIVEKIEELFTKLDVGVRSLKQAQALLKSYRRSVLKAAVEGELSREWREAHRGELEPASELLERILQERREKFSGKKYKEPASPDPSELPALPEGWKWTALEQLAWDSGYGTSTKCGYDFAGPPVLRIPNISQAKISFEDIKFADQTAKLKQGSELDAGDLLIIRTNGSRDLIGRSAIVRRQLDRPYYFASYLIRYRLLGGESVFAWLAAIWHSQLIRSWMVRTAATSAGQYNVSVSALNTLTIPLPPKQEANYIAEEVERRLSVVDKLEATVEENLKQAASLRQSILKQAFSGELVPQDPDDEPAGVLLARIREERQAAKQKAGKRSVGARRKALAGGQAPTLFPKSGG